jgi:hypothetical protein
LKPHLSWRIECIDTGGAGDIHVGQCLATSVLATVRPVHRLSYKRRLHILRITEHLEDENIIENITYQLVGRQDRGQC